jgi:hypothetical protein
MEFDRYEVVLFPNTEEKIGSVVKHVDGLFSAREETNKKNQSLTKDQLEMGIFYDFRGPYPPLSIPQRPKSGASPKRRPFRRHRER